MSYSISYSLMFPQGACVINLPPKFRNDILKTHVGLHHASMKASWTNKSGAERNAKDILRLGLSEGTDFSPTDTPEFTALEIAGHLAYAAFRYAYELFNNADRDERPLKDTEVTFRIDTVRIDAEKDNNSVIKNIILRVNKGMLKAEAWLAADPNAVPEAEAEEEDEESEEEEDEEDEEEDDEDDEEEEEEEEDEEEEEEDEDEEDEADEDEDEAEEDEADEDEDDEEAEDEPPPKKRARAKPKPRRTPPSRPRHTENGPTRRADQARDRGARVDFHAGPLRIPREKHSPPLFPMMRRTPLISDDRVARADAKVKSEIVGMMRELNALEERRNAAIQAERNALHTQNERLFTHYDNLLAQSRQHHGHLHDVQMEAVVQANSLTKSLAENHDAHRELNRQGWQALMQGIGLVQSSAQGQIFQERQMNEAYVQQLEREYAHQRELAAATQGQPAKPSGVGSMIAGAIKEIGPMLKPLLGIVMARAQAQAGDEDGEVETLSEVGVEVMNMRAQHARQGSPEPVPAAEGDSGDPTPAPAPASVPATLPPKPALRRPQPNPYHMQTPIEPEIVSGPSAEPPINSVTLPDGMETFALFSERMPIVSRLRLLVQWVSPHQRNLLHALLGDNWNRIVRAAGARHDGSALSSMVMLLGPLTNDVTRKKIRAIMSPGQNQLLDEIEASIRGRFPGLSDG